MAPLRLRHPKGVSTIQVAFDRDDFTVQDLQQEIFAVSEIPPSQQLLKSGYPPRALTVVPELPLASLGLKPGEQLIVNQVSSSASSRPLASSPPGTSLPPASSPPARSSAPVPRPAPPPSFSSGPEYVDTDGGVLIHRVVPDDNSCLFSAVALIFEQDIAKAPQLRKIVADSIRNDPTTYTEAILGMPPPQYINTILQPSSWGGAIELGLLAQHYRTAIASVDVESGRIDHFAPAHADMRGVLVYSGIHYDAATLAPAADAPGEWHQTVFPVTHGAEGDDAVLVAAKKLADKLRAKKAYTNTSTFDLKCEDCGQGLKGEKDARAHAQATGHVRFGEY